MPTYISLTNLTDKGVAEYKDTANRARAFKELAKSMGGEVKGIYWTLGTYDLVTIVEAPDDETAAAAALKVASLGNTRTATLRAFDIDEIEQIIAKT